MAKPAKWDSMTPGEQEAWLVKKRESARKHYESNPEKARKAKRKYRAENLEKQRESDRKSKQKAKQQTAADQFFIMAGAAEQLTKLKLKQ